MKRNLKEERRKAIRRKVEEYSNVYSEADAYEELIKPIHHGYNINYTFNEKFINHPHAKFISELIEDGFSEAWSKRKDFIDYCPFRKKTKEVVPIKKAFREEEILELLKEYPYFSKYFVRKSNWRNKYFYEADYYELKEFITVKKTKSYLTHRRVADGEKESFITRCIELFYHDPEYRKQYCSYNSTKWGRKAENRVVRRLNKAKILSSVKKYDDIPSIEDLDTEMIYGSDKLSSWYW